MGEKFKVKVTLQNFNREIDLEPQTTKDSWIVDFKFRILDWRSIQFWCY